MLLNNVCSETEGPLTSGQYKSNSFVKLVRILCVKLSL